MPEPATTFAYLWLASIDVLAPADAFTIVALGDSITDGYATTLDTDHAWPALLAKRLSSNKGTQHAAVINQGISGNQVLRDGAGISTLARFDRDVLSIAGVKWVILLEQIIPTIENNFRVYSDPDHRAIGGLSMGAFQSVQIGLIHLELFHYVLAYSGGFGGIGPATPGEIEEQSPWKELLANPEQTKKNLRLLFLGAGRQETPMLQPGKRLVELFKQKGINAIWADYPGGHVFSVWRNHLNYTAPMLFR